MVLDLQKVFYNFSKWLGSLKLGRDPLVWLKTRMTASIDSEAPMKIRGWQGKKLHVHQLTEIIIWILERGISTKKCCNLAAKKITFPQSDTDRQGELQSGFATNSCETCLDLEEMIKECIEHKQTNKHKPYLQNLPFPFMCLLFKSKHFLLLLYMVCLYVL